MTQFLRFILLATVLTAPAAAVDICNTELLFSYGVQNPQYLNQSSLVCQSGAAETCCSNNDQSWILERWNEKDRMVVQPFYELTIWLFKTIFQFYEDVILSAKYAYITPKTAPECRQSAEFLILNYMDRADLTNFINRLASTHEYLSDIRRGFFCSICSVKNQKYFDTDLKKIVFSYGQCSSLVKHTLDSVAVRVNKVMPILANINALLNCQLPDQPDDQDIFTIKADKFYAINRCFDAQKRLNTSDGIFSECREFCTDFSMVQPSESFEGLLKPLVTLKAKLLETKIVPSDPIWSDVFYSEIYAVERIKNEFFQADLSFQDLEKFDVVFDQYGLDLVGDAQTSLFSFSDETGMSSLLLEASVLNVVLVAVLGWFFKA